MKTNIKKIKFLAIVPKLFRSMLFFTLSLFFGWGFFLSHLSAASINDNFSNAIEINISTLITTSGITFPKISTNTTLSNLTLENYEGTCITVSRTIWYKFFSSSTFKFNGDTIGSNYDTVLTVFRGTNLNSLIQVACDDDGSGVGTTSKLPNNSFQIVTLDKNTTYYFHLAGFGSASSGGDLVFQATMTPVNFDETIPNVYIQSPSSGSTLQQLTYIFGTATDNVGVNRVDINISTYIGGAAKEWSGNGWVTEVANINDSPYWFQVDLSSQNGSSTNWGLNNTNFPIWANGVFYKIRARAKDANLNFSAIYESTFTYLIHQIPDDAQNANVLSLSSQPVALPIIISTTNANATYALEKTACSAGNRDIWEKYVSTMTATVEINTFGSQFDTVLAVRLSGSAPALQF